MPVQGLDLSAVTESTFNGSAVEQINLNGSEIWVGVTHAMTPVNGSVLREFMGSWLAFPQIYCDSNNNAYARNYTWEYSGWPGSLVVTSATTTRGGVTTSTTPFIDYDISTANLVDTSPIAWKVSTKDSYGNDFIVNFISSVTNNTISFDHQGYSQIAGTNHYTASITWDPTTLTFGPFNITTISITDWNRPPIWEIYPGFSLT